MRKCMKVLAQCILASFWVISLMLVGCTNHLPTPPLSVNAPSNPSEANITTPLEALQGIRMIDELNGWVVTAQGLFRTTDGGATWSDVTPPGAANVIQGNWFFLDAATGWFLTPEGSKGTLYSTEDGGRRWAKEEVPFNMGHIYFALVKGQRYGWVLKDYGPASGNHPVDVYMADSGRAWTLVHQGERPQNPNTGIGILPYGGTKTGIVFRPDMGAGWVTVQYPDPGKYGLYVSKDRGRSWHKQKIPVPLNLSDRRFVYMQVPRFFGEQMANVGVLPLRFWRPDESVSVFFVTYDGGESWKATTPLLTKGEVARVALADGTHWWVAAGSKLYSTRDGGKTWAEVGTLEGIEELDFVTPELGWALVKADGKTALFRTSDGGKSWTRVSYTKK